MKLYFCASYLHGSAVNLILYNFLPPSRRGSHVKSYYARTIIRLTTLSPYTKRLDFYSCALLTVYPTPHHVPASVHRLSPRKECVAWCTKAREGRPKEHRAKRKWPCETRSSIQYMQHPHPRWQWMDYTFRRPARVIHPLLRWVATP